MAKFDPKEILEFSDSLLEALTGFSDPSDIDLIRTTCFRWAELHEWSFRSWLDCWNQFTGKVAGKCGCDVCSTQSSLCPASASVLLQNCMAVIEL